jgi:hypothetical protein
VDCPAWLGRYKDNMFVKLLKFYLSKKPSRDRIRILKSEMQEWIRVIRYFPKITTGGVWDMINVIQIREYFGILPTSSGVKRKASDARTEALNALIECVPSKFDSYVTVYKDVYYPAAKKIWYELVSGAEFPLSRIPETPAMKGFVMFCGIHTRLQLMKPKRDGNYYPFFTLDPPKGKQSPKHYDNDIYFSRLIVSLIFNRSKAGSCGWDHSFLIGPNIMKAK